MRRDVWPVATLLMACLAVRAGEVELKLSNPSGLAVAAVPVTVGVPFPPDAVTAPEAIALRDARNQAVPCQLRVTSRWWDRGGSIQTAAVTFLADTAQPLYRLYYGEPPRAAAPRPKQPVTVRREGGAVLIATGPLRARLDASRPGLFNELLYDADGDGKFAPNETVIAAERPALMRTGELTSLAVAADRIEVEEEGPVRAQIRLVGHHAGADGRRGIRYDVRLSFYAGLPYVRIEHTVLQDTDRIFEDLPSVALDLIPAAGSGRLRIGLEDGAVCERSVAAGDRIDALQVGPGVREFVPTYKTNSWSRVNVPLEKQPNGDYAWKKGLGDPAFDTILEERLSYANDLEKRAWSEGPRFNAFEAKVTAGTEDLARGARLPGWVQYLPADRPWGLSAGIRHFWQQHPKALVWDHGTLRLGLYPGDLIDEPLHFHTGTAKTHTVELYCHRRDDPGVVPALAAAEHPPLYLPAPSWYCASKVWGDIVERREGKYRLYEDEVSAAVEPFIARHEKPNVQAGYGGEFGLVGFGDCGGGVEALNLETALDHGLAVQFARTADRRTYDRFETAVFHFRDIDVRQHVPAGQPFDWGMWLTPGYMPEAFAEKCAGDEQLRNKVFHWIGDQPPWLGGVYRHSYRHYANSQYTPYPPWSSRVEARGEMYSGHCAVSGHGWCVGLIDHYLLTGDRRSLEVAEMVGHWVMEHGGTHWGRDNWKYRDLARLYRATGKKEYRDRLYEAIDAIYAERDQILPRLKEQDKSLMSPYYTILQFIAEVHRLTGDPEVRRKYLELIDPWLANVPKKDSSVGPVFGYLRDYKDSRCHTDFADLAYAALLTGDKRYLEASLPSLDFYLHFAYHSTAWFSVPEYLYALDQHGLSGLSDPPRRIRNGQAYVSDAADRPFTVVLTQEEGYRVNAAPSQGRIVITAPSGKIAAEETVTMGGTDVHRLKVPADGETGVYKVEAKADRCWFAIGADLPLADSPPAVLVPGKYGQAVRLENLARLVIPAEGRIQLTEGTIEFWVQPLWSSPQPREKEVPYHYDHFFDSRDGEFDHGFTINTWDSGAVGARKSLMAASSAKDKSDGVACPIDWRAGEWHHLALAWRRGEPGKGLLRLYVDGKLVSEKADASIFPEVVSPNLTLGSNTPATPNAMANAVIDELRISKVMREPDISGVPTKDADTLLLLHFDDEADLKPGR